MDTASVSRVYDQDTENLGVAGLDHSMTGLTKPSTNKLPASSADMTTPSRRPFGVVGGNGPNSAQKFFSPKIQNAAAKMANMTSVPRSTGRGPDDFGTIFTSRGSDDSMAAESIFSLDEAPDAAAFESALPNQRISFTEHRFSPPRGAFTSPARSSASNRSDRERVAQLESLANEYERALSEQSDHIERITSGAATAEQEHDALCDKYTAALSKLRVRDESLAAATKRVTTLTAELASAKADIAAAAAREAALADELAARDDDLAAEIAARASAEAVAAAVTAERDSLAEEAQSLREQLASASQLLHENKRRVMGMCDAAAAAAAPINGVRASLGPARNRGSAVSHSLMTPDAANRSVGGIDDARRRSNESRASKTLRKPALSRLSSGSTASSSASAIDELQNEVARLTGENEVLQDLTETLQQELDERTAAADAARAELDARAAEHSQLVARLEAVGAEAASLEVRAAGAAAREAELEEELAAAKIAQGVSERVLHSEIRELREDAIAASEEKQALEEELFAAREARVAAEEAAEDACAARVAAEERADEASWAQQRAEAEATALRWVAAQARAQARVTDAARARAAELTEELKAVREEYISQLDAMRDEYNVAGYREKYCTLAGENALLRKEVATAELIAVEARATLSSAEEATTLLESRVAELRDERDRARAVVARAAASQAQFDYVVGQYDEACAAAVALQAQVEALQSAHARAVGALRDGSAAATNALAEERDAALADLADTRSQLEGVTGVVETLESALGEKTAAAEGLEQSLAVAEAALAASRSRVDALGDELTAARAAAEAQAGELAAVEARATGLEKELSEVMCELEAETQQHRAAAARITHLEGELAAATEARDAASASCASLEAALAEKEQARAAAAAEAARKVSELERRLSLLDTESMSVTGGAAFLTQEVARYKAEVARANEACAAAEADLSESNAALRAAERARDDLEQELRRARRQAQQQQHAASMSAAASSSSASRDADDVTSALPAGAVVRRALYDALQAELAAAKQQRDDYRRAALRAEEGRGEVAAQGDAASRRVAEARAEAEAATQALEAARAQGAAATARAREAERAAAAAETAARTESARAKALEERIEEAVASRAAAEAAASELERELREAVASAPAAAAAAAAAAGVGAGAVDAAEVESLRASLRALKAAEAKHMLQVERLQAQVSRQRAEAGSGEVTADLTGTVAAKEARIAQLESANERLRTYILDYKTKGEERFVKLCTQLEGEKSVRKSLASKFTKMRDVLLRHAELLRGEADLAALVQSLTLSS